MRSRTAGLLVLALATGCASESGSATAGTEVVVTQTATIETPSPTPSPAPVVTTAAPRPTATASAAPAAGTVEFGYFRKTLTDGTEPQLSFDKAEFLTGDAANAAAARDGQETPVPNDYYVSNKNPALRTLTLAASCEVVGSTELNGFRGEQTSDPLPWALEDLLAFVDFEGPRGQTGFHITYGAGGKVVKVEEQFVP